MPSLTSSKTTTTSLWHAPSSSSLSPTSTSREYFTSNIAIHNLQNVKADQLKPRETKQKTLEEIAAAFGDNVVLVTERHIASEEAVMDDKIRAEHLEIK